MFTDEECRRHVRIREDIPVCWQASDPPCEGEGVVRNFSVSGVLLEINTMKKPDMDSVFVLTTTESEGNLIIPDCLRLVWIRQLKVGFEKYLCGMEFVSPSLVVVEKLTRYIEEWFVRMADGSNLNILDRYVRGVSGRI